jgi:hypothetical protein
MKNKRCCENCGHRSDEGICMCQYCEDYGLPAYDFECCPAFEQKGDNANRGSIYGQ